MVSNTISNEKESSFLEEMDWTGNLQHESGTTCSATKWGTAKNNFRIIEVYQRDTGASWKSYQYASMEPYEQNKNMSDYSPKCKINMYAFIFIDISKWLNK